MPDPLRLSIHPGPLLEAACDALILPLFQDGDLTGNAAAADAALDGLIRDMRERGEFRGEACQVAVLPTLGRLPAARAALVGLGKQADCTPNTYRRAMSAVSRVLGKRGLRSAAVDVADAPAKAREAAILAAEGAELARYVPDRYRTGERRDSFLHELLVAGAAEEDLREGSARGGAKNLARDLTNEPGNVLDPPELARRAEMMAAETGLEYECLDEAEMERLGMGAILAVTQGSEIPACFLVMRHFPKGKRREGTPLLALVGKAVTFDTGGISIKPSAEMDRMKGDMAGGAAVVGAMQAIAELKVPLDVIGIVPAAVNMPDGRAWKPGDVITTMSGKTVETISTDAEGRMLLADALCYARGQGATHLVDIATLTGACVVALGRVASGLYGTDEALAETVREAGEAAGERHWRMPLYPEYREQIRSEIADLKNSGGRMGGSVTAAMFLKEFAGETPWVHLDIAGTGHYEKARPWAPAGPTGIGVGTFINLARRLAEESAG